MKDIDLVKIILLSLGSPSIPIPLDLTNYLLVPSSSILDQEVVSHSIIPYQGPSLSDFVDINPIYTYFS